jgi:hypothetical protein
MQLMDETTAEAIGLLTRLAYGDVALVRDALAEFGDDADPQRLIEYIRARRDRGSKPAAGKEVVTEA